MATLGNRRSIQQSAVPNRYVWGVLLGLLVGLLLALARAAGLFSTWQLRSTNFLYGDTSPGDTIIIVAIRHYID